MQIGHFKKIDMAQWPGKLCSVVYLIGCNFRCPWCFVPELVLKRIKSPQTSPKEFFKYLKQKKDELDGVVIDGGEPCASPALPLFCKRIKELGYLIKLNTNGSNPQMLEGLIKNKLIDAVALDIKAPKEKYAQIIGFNDCAVYYLLDKIEKSIGLVKQSGLGYEFSTTLSPLLNKADIVKIARWLSPADKYILRRFEQKNLLSPELMILKPLPRSQLIRIQQAAAPFFATCLLK